MQAKIRSSVSLLLTLNLLFVSNVASQQQPTARVFVGPNVQASRAWDGNSWEVLIAAHPRDPKYLVGAGTVNRTDGSEPRGGTALNVTRVYHSRDGGNTWATLRFPEIETTSGADPIVAYTPKGTALFASISPVGNKSAVKLYRSPDAGLTWDKMIELPNMDHQQFQVDETGGPFAGNIYIDYLMGGKMDGKVVRRLSMIRSEDDGRTWSEPVVFAQTTDNILLQVSCVPLVFSDGEMFVPYIMGVAPGLKGAGLGRELWSVRSRDGARTFAKPERHAIAGGGSISSSNKPFYAIDRSKGPYRDRIYAVWTDRDSDIVRSRKAAVQASRLIFSYSSDRGKTWTKPRRIPEREGEVIEQFYPPSIAVNDEGTLAISWLDVKETPADVEHFLADRYITASIDGGETFLPPVKVSSRSTNPKQVADRVGGVAYADTGRVGVIIESPRQGGRSTGRDYQGLTAAADGTFHPFWIDARTGRYQVWTASVRVERMPASPTPELVDADVTDKVTFAMDPYYEFSPADELQVPIRLKNKSGAPVYGPFKVEVIPWDYQERNPSDGTLGKKGAWPLSDGLILNADNKKTGAGAIFNYSDVLGNYASLPPGAVSEPIVWRFSKGFDKHQIFPSFKVKITGRVKKGDAPATSQSQL